MGYKDRIWIVDSDLVGPKRRRNNPDGFHPMMRAQWGALDDKLRAVLAKYYTVYNSSKGKTLWNMANPGNAFDGGSDGVGRLADQATDIVLSLSTEPGDHAGNTDLTLRSTVQTDKNWNDYSNRDPASTGFIHHDLDNFNSYIESILTPTTEYHIDTTSVHYILSANAQIREASGVTCEISSHYQFDITSAPPYEEVIAAPALPEHILPSTYILQGESHNTSSSPLTDYSINSISLDGNIDWFENSTAQETNEGVYYELYAEAAQSLVVEGTVGDVGQELERLKNMVVLHSDLSMATHMGISLGPVPFYTKITIGADPDNVTGKSSNVPIYTMIANREDTKDFIDYAQLEAVRSYLASPGPTQDSFRVTLQTLNSANNMSDFDFTTSTQEYPSLYKATPTLRPGPNNVNSSQLDTINEQSQGDNFVLLRDFERMSDGYQLDPAQITNAEDHFRDDVVDVIRDYTEILAGTKAHSEVLMYIIEKRRLTDGSPGPLLQRFFISPKFDLQDNTPIVFYDTQVKYGQRYRYNIKKIVTVFGSTYVYGPGSYEVLGPPDDIEDTPPPEDLGIPGLGDKVAFQEILTEGADELEETQDLFEELQGIGIMAGEKIVDEILQDLLTQLGPAGSSGLPPFLGGTGPSQQGPGAFGLGPGGFQPPTPQGPNIGNVLPQTQEIQQRGASQAAGLAGQAAPGASGAGAAQNSLDRTDMNISINVLDMEIDFGEPEF